MSKHLQSPPHSGSKQPLFASFPANVSNENVPVLVFADSLLVLHHGCVGIIRSLGKMGVPVYSVVKDRFTPAAVSKYLTGAFICETHGLDAPRLLEGMAAIGERLNRPTIVIPTDDVGAIFLAEQAAILRKWFIFPQQSAALPRVLANKRELYFLCKKLGVPCPEVTIPHCLDDVREFIEHATFPVVVKAAEAWLLPKGERTTVIISTPKQLYAIYRNSLVNGKPNLIFQEYISPAHGEDWFYHGYRNEKTDCSAGFTGRKLRSYPPLVGPTTLGKAIENERLQCEVERLLEAISYNGIMDLDYRFDKRDGEYKLVDFNPRIGAQFRLFEDAAGMDVARALYLDLMGKRVHASSPLNGRTFIVEFHDLAASFGYFRRGALKFSSWWRSLRGKREFAWFSFDDPAPFLLVCIRLLFRVIECWLQLKPKTKITNRMPKYVSGRRSSKEQTLTAAG